MECGSEPAKGRRSADPNDLPCPTLALNHGAPAGACDRSWSGCRSHRPWSQPRGAPPGAASPTWAVGVAVRKYRRQYQFGPAPYQFGPQHTNRRRHRRNHAQAEYQATVRTLARLVAMPGVPGGERPGVKEAPARRAGASFLLSLVQLDAGHLSWSPRCWTA